MRVFWFRGGVFIDLFGVSLYGFFRYLITKKRGYVMDAMMHFLRPDMDVTWLVETILKIMRGPFGNSIDENKKLVKSLQLTQWLIHGDRSKALANYTYLPIEVEFFQMEINFRNEIISQLHTFIDSSDYNKRAIEDCWDDFLFLHSINYRSDTAGLHWDNCSVESLLMNVVPILLGKIELELSFFVRENKTNSDVFRKYLLLISGIFHRFNDPNPFHVYARNLINRFDEQDILKGQYI